MSDLAARKRELMRRRLAEAGLANTAQIPKRDNDDDLPLSYAQSRMWFLQQIAPNSPAYNVCLAIDLRGPLDTAALHRSFQRLVERHEILRTRYTEGTDGEPRQIVDKFAVVTMPDSDLRGMDAAERDDAVARIAREESGHVFDLRREHPLRLRLLRRGVDDNVLVLTVHHIAWDGFTFNTLSRDLSALYREDTTGRPAELDPLPIQYADFAVWQRKTLGSKLDREVGYWRRALDPMPENLPLPTDLPRPAVRSDRGDRLFRAFDPRVTELVGEFAQTRGVTPFMVVFAAYAALLGRYTGATDVPIGSASMNRDAGEVEKLIGNFGNTLVLRADLTGDPTFAELVQRVQKVCTEGYAHQDLPFDLLVERLRPPRVPGRSVLFDVMLLFLVQGLQGFDLPGVQAGWETVHNDTTQFDLALEAFVTGGQMRVEATFSTELFTHATVDRFLAHLESLLTTALADPSARLSALDFLAPDERSQLLGAEIAVPDTTLVELFAQQVARTPDATAVVFEGSSLTYAELDAEVSALAGRLAAQGVRPGSIVGVHLDRSLDLVVALYAIQRAGAAYLPLDPSYPADRLAMMIEDAQPVVVLEPGLLDGPTADVVKPAPGDAAYVIYTSGSTGRPKGVVVSHRAIVNRLQWMQDEYQLTGDDRVLQKTPSSFDVSVWEFFWPLITGATLVVAKPDGHKDPVYLAELINRENITTVHFVPSMLRAFVESGARPKSLKRVICSGEALPSDLGHALPHVHNLYGPTEAAVDVTYWPAAAGVGNGTVPIGLPVWNTQTYVLDRFLQPVAPGVAGELYLGGVQLAEGYLNRPGLTASRFIANPFGAGRLYRTGDLVRWTGHALEYLGRTDDQVKIRGFRVELGEIEAALTALPEVVSAGVVARTERQQLVGYVVLRDGANVSEIRQKLAAGMPEHLVPSVIVEIDELPLSPSGKLDRRALPEPELTALSEEPATPREQAVAALFAELLGVERVGRHDDFFALGGHSLLATRLVGRVRADLGAEIAIGEVFEAPTVAGLAGLLDSTGRKRPALTPMPRPRRIPLSSAQQRLWFLYRLEGPSATYNIPFAVRIDGPLDTDALNLALADVVRRHEVLRTIYPEFEGKPYQQVLGVLPSLKFGEGAPREAAARAFELDREPPFEATLYRVGDNAHVLSLLAHHIASDGWSAERLVADLTTAYHERSRGRTPTWAPLPVQYADYALWQRDLLANLADEQLTYWTRQLAELPEEISLPADRPRPVEATYAGDAVAFRINPETHRALANLVQQSGGTVFMALQATVAALLGLVGAGDDIPLGVPVAGRTDAALDGLAGFFVNNLVLRTDLSGDPTFRQLLDRVRRTDLEAYAHQDLPFERIVEALNPARQFGRHPLFQVMLAFQRAAGGPVPFGAASLREEHVDFYTARLDLSFHLFERSGDSGLDGWLVYSEDRFDRSTADDLVARLVSLLDQLVANPDRPLSRASVLTSGERSALLGRTTDHEVPDTTLVELFAQQVSRTSDATAVTFEGSSLTYAELDVRVAELAGRLAARGVRPGSVVGVRLDRSLELIVALYAIQRAGAAYLPLDPSYPADRLAMMVEDAQPVVVLEPGLLDGPTAEVVAPAPGDAAYVIYTSGSTGRPKGVVVSHRAIVNRLLWMQDEYGLTAEDRVLQKTPSSFDVSVWEFFWPLITGATLVVAKPDGHKDPVYLAELINRENISTVHFVPSMLRAFVESGARPESLKRVICSGEALPSDLGQALPHVHNLYGPTEAAVDVTYWDTAEGVGDGTVPIGKPVWNTQVYVLDRHLRLVPPGVPGELYLAGVQLAEGYLNRPGLTASRFVASPFSNGERLYRTGDLVKWTGAALEYLGRTDDQVKIRGFRVELGEIEVAIGKVAGVRQAAVVVRDDRLVGYVVGDATPDAIRTELARELPDHMVPAALVPLPELPLTPSGKLDRKALPAPDFAALAGDAKPADEREAVLCGLFAEVLGLPEVGAQDSFFTLGGDSILSVQLVSRARKAGVVITPRQVFEHRTPAALATLIAAPAHAIADEPVGLVEPTPIMRWTRGGLAQAMLLVAPEDLTEEGLVRTVQAVLDRHDVLRSRWDGTTLEVPKESFDAAEVVRRATSDLDTELAATRERLTADRMIQVVWFDDRVLIVADHLVIDGVSWRILMDDLAEAWAGRELTRTGTSFRRWSQLLAEQQRGGETGMWRDVLDGADPVLPLGGEQLVTEFTVPLPDSTGVRELLLAALARALESWRGRSGDVVVAVEGHGREEQIGADLSATVGWFTTIHPVRLRPGIRIRDIAEQLDALPDHGLGYGLVRPFAGLREPTIVVNYHGRLRAGSGAPWIVAPEAPVLRVPPKTPHWALEVNAVAVGDTLRVEVTGPDEPGLVGKFRAELAGSAPTAIDTSFVDVSAEDIDEFEVELGTW
ncbi:non-ribosomal peptide synthetase [Lentzea terrae]|uniref:non-ribosomal peptide synthetase n=1 Tax=Lentzea terrae TaxID=2200761 RepID=UPI000DD3D2E8|nr:non-ribosomal peptide synthetase [Lentzea terrae]